jgi:glutathione peroxidase
MNFNTSFPLYAKLDVKGSSQHPLYAFLTSKARGFLGTKAVKWNFTKFLVDRHGNVIKRFAPKTEPEKIAPFIEQLLGNS